MNGGDLIGPIVSQTIGTYLNGAMPQTMSSMPKQLVLCPLISLLQAVAHHLLQTVATETMETTLEATDMTETDLVSIPLPKRNKDASTAGQKQSTMRDKQIQAITTDIVNAAVAAVLK